MSSTLPEGWEMKVLSEIGKWGSGGTPKATNSLYYGGNIPWAVIGDLNDALVTETSNCITELGLSESSAKLVEPGTILIAMYGSIGKLGIAGVSMATNQAIAFVTSSESVVRRDYLFHFLRSQREAFTSSGKGMTQQNISQTILKSWPIPVAPLTEQAKIVEILEEQLAHLDAVVKSVQTVRDKAAQFRRSLLFTALDASLSDSLLSPKPESDDWLFGELGEFCEMYQPKTISTKELLKDGEFPVYGANGKIGYFDSYNHEDSEVAVTCRGASCGTVNVIPPRAWITGNAMVVRPLDDRLSKEYLRLVLQSADFRRVITGTAQPQITRASLTRLPVQVAPRSYQMRIVEFLGEQLSRLEATLSLAEEVEQNAYGLRRSLLHAAFSGELTRTWREANV